MPPNVAVMFSCIYFDINGEFNRQVQLIFVSKDNESILGLNANSPAQIRFTNGDHLYRVTILIHPPSKW